MARNKLNAFVFISIASVAFLLLNRYQIPVKESFEKAVRKVNNFQFAGTFIHSWTNSLICDTTNITTTDGRRVNSAQNCSDAAHGLQTVGKFFSSWSTSSTKDDVITRKQEQRQYKTRNGTKSIRHGPRVLFPAAKEQIINKTEIDKWLHQTLKLHERFRYRTSDSCNNTCSFEKEVCEASTFDDWDTRKEILKAVPLYRSSITDDYIFPWEKDYLSHPPLQDIRHLPDLSLSRIYFLPDGKTVNAQRYIECEKNDLLIFRADLIDAKGNGRKFGGDEVRAWITDEHQIRSMTGTVRDLKNGTYLIGVTPAWTGQVKLNVAVVYPREYLRAALYHMKEGRHRFIYGLFKNLQAQEATICHTTPNIPGRPCVCNFTTSNRRPFYCGRPLDNRLTCIDWVSIQSARGPISKDYTEAEASMASGMSRPLSDATIQHSIRIVATDSDEPEPILPPCTDLGMTWTHPSPRGMWSLKSGSLKWESFLCKEIPNAVMESPWRIQECLRSTTLWLIGDSNLNNVRKLIAKKGNFKTVHKDELWTVRSRMEDADHNITMIFRGHEYPLFHYLTGGSTPRVYQGGVEDFLEEIPATGNHIVIIHYNLHFAISHLSAIFQRFLAIREAVSVLLKRNPSVLVVIRGPHISTVEWQTNHLFGGDVQGTFIMTLLKIVFRDLRGKILFLDGWDMTISLNNAVMHPADEVVISMIRTLLSFTSSTCRVQRIVPDVCCIFWCLVVVMIFHAIIDFKNG